MDKIDEYKIEKLEQQSKIIGNSEANELMDYICCGLEIGMAVAYFSPLFAAAALGYFITAQMERECESGLKKDLEEVENIQDEDDFEEYRIERIEVCEEEIKDMKATQITYGIASAIALGGMLFSPAIYLVPLYVSLYGFLESRLRNNVAKNDLEELSAMDYDVDDYAEDYNETLDASSDKSEKVKTYTKSSDAVYAY